MELIYHPHSIFELLQCFDAPIKFNLENELKLLLNLRLNPAKQRYYQTLVNCEDGTRLTLEERVHTFRHLLFQDIYSITPCINSDKCQAIWKKLDIHHNSPELVY